MKMRMTKRQANTYRKRLLRLAEFLRKLPPKRFDYSSWVGDDWQGKQDLSCGTTACALGWAATMPTFRKIGLELRSDWNGAGFVTLKGHAPDVAAEHVFGVNYDEFGFLFCAEDLRGRTAPGFDATAKQVAKHIEKFVATWNPELEEVHTTDCEVP